MVSRRELLARLDAAIAARPSPAIATVLGFDVAGDADAPVTVDVDVATQPARSAPAPHAQALRLGERLDAAHRALAHLDTLDRMPLVTRDALDAEVADVARTLAHVRRSLRALGAELSALERDGRALVGRAFERRARREGTP